MKLSNMFDFEKLEVYNKAKSFYIGIVDLFNQKKIPITERDQLRRASLSIVLNLAEGTGRFTKPDKRNFYIISRGSVFETAAIMDILLAQKLIDEEIHNLFYTQLEELSKMLYAMINKLNEG